MLTSSAQRPHLIFLLFAIGLVSLIKNFGNINPEDFGGDAIKLKMDTRIYQPHPKVDMTALCDNCGVIVAISQNTLAYRINETNLYLSDIFTKAQFENSKIQTLTIRMKNDSVRTVKIYGANEFVNGQHVKLENGIMTKL